MSDHPGQGAHGFVTVPAEPTDPMCEAMLERVEEAEAGRGAPFKWPDIEHMFDIYTAAIAAAPRRSPAVCVTETETVLDAINDYSPRARQTVDLILYKFDVRPK